MVALKGWQSKNGLPNLACQKWKAKHGFIYFPKTGKKPINNFLLRINKTVDKAKQKR